MKIELQGVIQTTSPWHVSDLLNRNLRYDLEKGWRSYGNNGLPLTATVQKRLVGSGETGETMIPYFPANDIRGRLRRFATKEVCEALSVREEKISLNTYEGLSAGNFTGRPDTVGTTLEEMSEFRRHFFMGLFGGGPRTLPSKLVTSDLDPICEEFFSVGRIPSRFRAHSCAIGRNGLVDYFFCTRRHDIMKFSNIEDVIGWVEGGIGKIEERADEVSTTAEKRKKAKNDPDVIDDDITKKSDLSNMFAFECIPAGVPLFLELGFSADPTDAQVGLLLEALLSLFNENALGGLVSKGAGRFAGHVDLVVDGANKGSVIERAGDTDSRTFIASENADMYLDAKNEVLESITADDLNRFFEYGKPAKKVA